MIAGGPFVAPLISPPPSSLDAAAVALIARMTAKPNNDRARAISTLIAALKAAGVWTKLEILYLTAAHDAQAARLNWKNVSTYDLTPVNTTTFTADRGYAGNGSNSYLDTGWAPTGGFVQNDALLGAYLNGGTDTVSSSAPAFGGNDATNFAFLTPWAAGNQVRGSLNDTSGGANFSSATITTRFGLTTTERTASNLTTAYKNGVSVGTKSTVSNGVTTRTLWIGGRNNNGSLSGGVDNRVACAFAGASLGATAQAALYTALNTYLTALGAA